MKRTITSLSVVVALGLVAAGCSGSSGSSGGSVTSAAPVESADLTLAVTDAASDDIDVFEVDIVGFRFERTDGASVEVLAQTARVDFAQLVSVSEVIAGASLPRGTYQRAFMTLDFGGASVRINGNTQAASLVSDQGAPLSGREELEIAFPNGGFTVGNRRGYFAEVDFDLDQSLTVDVAANRVTVSSVFFATIDPSNPKPARTPGLASAFTGTSFVLDVRRGLGLLSRGRLTVTTTAATVFGVDGQPQAGQTGYDALKAKGDNTLVVASGVVDPLTRTMAATRVLVLPQDLDEVGGLVVARTGGPGQDPLITLRGVSVRRQAGSVTFNDQVTLRASVLQTRVSKRGVAGGTLNADAINVGQRLLAYGRFAGTELDLTQANAGFVRLVSTTISGAAAAPPSGGRLDVDLTRIGRRTIGAFDFTVAGVKQGDTDALACNTGGLGLASVTSGTPVVVRGFFAPVTSTTPTGTVFQADSVVNRTDAGSLLRVRWIPAATAPLSSGSGNLTLDVSAALIKSIDRGLVAPTQLTQNPALAGTGNDGFFAIRQGARLTLFRRYEAWRDEFQARVNAGARVHHVRAIGKWDVATNTLTAQRAFALITP